MSAEMAEAIRQLVQEKGIDEDLVLRMIEDTLKAAYKRKYGTNDNAVVTFNETRTDVSIYSRKTIVDGVYNPVIEIELEEALALDPECELGDELLIEVDPREFDRISVQSAKQTAHQSIRDIQKDSLHSEYKDKVGEIIIGYYQRERNGNIYVDLGKVEGILPKKFQSPRETYRPNDRIKALITEVKKAPSGLQIVLSRTDPDFVRRILELEVPEIYDKTVEIHKIVREPGYRTKVAVFSNRDDVDPVGACVGLKGVRIQAVIRELEGEKIDVLKYDEDPRVFIRNALSPAEVNEVVIMDEAKRSALAVVSEPQFSLAIGKQGLNVRLANRLADWSIDVKTDEQFAEMDITADSRKAANDLFSDEVFVDEESSIADLPGITDEIAALLSQGNILKIGDLLALGEEQLSAISGITEEHITLLGKLMRDSFDIVEEEPEVIETSDSVAESETPVEESPAVEEYECPECGGRITIDMTTCPNCGIGLSFEYEDEE
ncbi:transcription termination factor NusA [Treponema zuelzerae]|uniref:Transcription termination/antitermination protein NusA n=1 Tax=Teretinema zuelzerae TaxID=156 RepID=A0AAE3EHY8_9SPIR|nr:transcription termination factor NusA [Teretinema zuelzerae]MCD1654772.1 transcription termination factor NusA [Teretinema zuelzerae]